MPTSSSLVTNLPADFNTFGQGVDTSLQDLLGGTTGQVLSKTSNTNMDFTWVTPTDQTPLTTKGDLFTFSTVDARLGVGTNGQTLVADSSTATGLKWATPAGGGKVLQVVSATYSTAVANATNSYTDSGLTASITPTASTSKILVLVSQMGCQKNSANAGNALILSLFRGATNIGIIADYGLWTNTATAMTASFTYTYLDSPATTSSTTYKTRFANVNNTSSVSVQSQSTEQSSIVLLEIGA